VLVELHNVRDVFLSSELPMSSIVKEHFAIGQTLNTTNMAGTSRWADDQEDAAARKREKEEKKRAKAEKQRKLDEAEAARKRQQEEEAAHAAVQDETYEFDRPRKRRKVDNEPIVVEEQPRKLLRFAAPGWGPCRQVDNFERLNHIEEGSYGWVSRARETSTGEVVALKKLKMDNLNDGFPVTALREIQTLKESHHRHIVDLREVVVGEKINDVFLVMEFLEHDLKTLQEDMAEPFMQSEIKTLMLQLTSAVEYLHDNWIMHRDLKTSNILMNNRGEIKLADFGMARYFGDPVPPNLTQLVVTLWYRAPELLLGADTYNQAIDMWSVGCIFGELLKNEPLLQGTSEVDELTKVILFIYASTSTKANPTPRSSSSAAFPQKKRGQVFAASQTPAPSVSHQKPKQLGL
jgi:cell division cycle 2-like